MGGNLGNHVCRQEARFRPGICQQSVFVELLSNAQRLIGLEFKHAVRSFLKLGQ